MPAPHRLASLYAARPDDARAELRAALTAASADVRAAARALGVGEQAVHRWIRLWELRAWLTAAYPAAERARVRGQKGPLARRTRTAHVVDSTEETHDD